MYVLREHREFFENELKPFCEANNVSLPRLIMACLIASWPTIKKELPRKRKFQLNGQTVMP